MPIRNWRLALNRFTIEFGDRVAKFLKLEFTQTNLHSPAWNFIILILLDNQEGSRDLLEN